MGNPEQLSAAFAAAREGMPLRALSGYLDEEAEPPRLYTSIELDVYVELRKVVAVLRDPDQRAPGIVWVPRDLRLELGFVGDPPRGYGDLDPTDLLGLGGGPGGAQPYLPLGVAAMRCKPYPQTSHTIGWCATD